MGKTRDALRDLRAFQGKLAVLFELEDKLETMADFDRVIKNRKADAKAAQREAQKAADDLEAARVAAAAEHNLINKRVDQARASIVDEARKQAALEIAELKQGVERARNELAEARQEVAFAKSEAQRIRAEAKVKSDEMLASARREARKLAET